MIVIIVQRILISRAGSDNIEKLARERDAEIRHLVALGVDGEESSSER
jgi:hypothetical protein